MSWELEKNKNIGIFGLGVTGISVYQELKNIVQKVICFDDKNENLESFANKFDKEIFFPINSVEWAKLDKIIVSPGVPRSHDIFKIAKKYNISISSDIELFVSNNPNSGFIFITGTNGKSTVTALTGHIVVQSGVDYPIGGNIGKVAMSLPQNSENYIFELSSFQIELLNNINPKIAVLTNVTPDHLDRYKTIEEYANVKSRILTSSALKIIGINSDISRKIYYQLLDGKIVKMNTKNEVSNLIPVSTEYEVKNGIFCSQEYLYDNYFDNQKYRLPSIYLSKALHNRENIGISYAIARALGIKPLDIIKALENFKGLDHRMQYISSYRNIDFYDDSKATNISSAIASLSSFDNIIWFAGGIFKEDGFEALLPVVKNIKKAYLFGKSRELFAKFLDSKVDYEMYKDLQEAFANALEYSKTFSGRVTFLLAPACSSYDQFKNFEERGRAFVEMVANIEN